MSNQPRPHLNGWQYRMDRHEIEMQSGEVIEGCTGLWVMVLAGLVDDYKRGKYSVRRVVDDMSYPIPMIAAALQTDPRELRKKIMKAAG